MLRTAFQEGKAVGQQGDGGGEVHLARTQCGLALILGSGVEMKAPRACSFSDGSSDVKVARRPCP